MEKEMNDIQKEKINNIYSLRCTMMRSMLYTSNAFPCNISYELYGLYIPEKDIKTVFSPCDIDCMDGETQVLTDNEYNIVSQIDCVDSDDGLSDIGSYESYESCREDSLLSDLSSDNEIVSDIIHVDWIIIEKTSK